MIANEDARDGRETDAGSAAAEQPKGAQPKVVVEMSFHGEPPPTMEAWRGSGADLSDHANRLGPEHPSRVAPGEQGADQANADPVARAHPLVEELYTLVGRLGIEVNRIASEVSRMSLRLDKDEGARRPGLPPNAIYEALEALSSTDKALMTTHIDDPATLRAVLRQHDRTKRDIGIRVTAEPGAAAELRKKAREAMKAAERRRRKADDESSS